MNSPFEPPTGAPVWPSPANDTGGRRRRNRRNSAIGVGAGLLGGGAVGLLMVMPSLSSAATTTEPTDTTVVVEDTSDTETDTGTGTDAGTGTGTGTETAEDIAPDRGARLREVLQPLVDDGTITAAQADAVATQLAESFPGRGGPGGGHHGPGGLGGWAFDGEVLADLLGIDVATLRTELQSGSTIAEIAAAHGVDAQTVIDALVAEAKSHLDLSVSNGRLTQEEADAKLAELTERITNRVNNGRPERGEDEIEASQTEASTDAGS
jgi:hypothetical protein